MPGKDVALKYFSRDDEDKIQWKCACGKIISQKGTGNTNIINHIEKKHP